MRQKLVVLLISGALCLGGIIPVVAQEDYGIKHRFVYATPGEYEQITGKKVGKYNEAPMLRIKVAAGELPPVEERLPEEPLVIDPLEEIGQYGGTLHEASLGPGTMWDVQHGMIEQQMFQVNNSVTKMRAEVAKSYELSKDKKILTVYLRKGMKWSDGYPFTVDDILFWWEDYAHNEELSPGGVPSWLGWTGGEEFEKVDDYTLRIHFPKPRPPIVNLMSNWNTIQNFFYDPKHYLEKYHIKYNPDADKLAKEEGYDHWWQLFDAKREVGWWAWDHVGIPVVSPWMLQKITPTGRIWVRNPYFHAVDSAGNQLPYIDKAIVATMGNEEMVSMRTVAGELSFSGYFLWPADYPLFTKNAEKGNYRVLVWKASSASVGQLAFNLNHPDSVLRKIFQDIRFRRAMSLAINRDEINEVIFYGRAEPAQSTVDPGCSYYKEEWARAYAQYDPERANELLDSMGLDWEKNHRWRLRPDGKPLSVSMPIVEGMAPVKLYELVGEYWREVGVRVNIKVVQRSFYGERADAGELDVGTWSSDRMQEFRNYIPGSTKFNPLSEMAYAVKWGLWRQSGGESGWEPPEDWKKQWERMEKWYMATTEEEYQKLAKEIWGFFSEKLILIGTVRFPPSPIVVKNNLRNVPEEAYYGDGPNWEKSVFPTQWFFK